ncbi:D-alanyl-D-alanine carboxypeptidase/D-alanyl-D-alanine-endopeptidase [Halobacillus litoralis]|uniref:D-alanyl-D-alanine carboxypeptidase/D-alanyl-D-alanine endopeptidase n=1 Tax=Halobacillus litoralis TaxID=45668 RepID=UPI00273E0B9B|nr:D-alanyl-D-alanine carboxypeptidase/D-alanyl-D-alanine-endopeptidase [Halobacillus litoralis]WLR47173.1 D-alanyl-D-alanine carboxypeptidase/D-alanyl-D-alanine-endopeptidase [Halobacillus litoralis]
MQTLPKTKTAISFLGVILIFTAAFLIQKEGEARIDETLQEKVERVLTDERLEGAVAGISIRHADTGAILFEKNANLRLVPASNTKLFTGAAAPETLGPGHTFTTELWTDGELKRGILNGNLYLKGKGDPTLRAEDLDAMAQALKEAGVRKITGRLVADDSWYDDVRLSDGVQWTDETEYYGAQVSALTLSPDKDFDAGTVIVKTVPAHVKGSPAHIEIFPDNDYVRIINQTVTSSAKKGTELEVERRHGTNDILVKGEIALDDPFSHSWVAVSEPSGLVRELFQRSLQKYNIIMKGEHARSGVTPEEATLLVTRNSMALEELFLPFMKLSNNGHAEVLVKEMGRVVHGEGSWERGLSVVEDELAKMGVDVETMQMKDGSGLSRSNLIPAHEISELLFQVQDKEWFPVLFQSLPVAGNSERFVGGTLRSRMIDTHAEGKVQAKTGTLSEVSSLSGYVTTADGEPLIFAFVFNHVLSDEVKDIEDQLAILLSEHTFRKN